MTIFSEQSCGKWILAGEHAVLRGSPALVFPAQAFAMKFSWQGNRSPLAVSFGGVNGNELQLIFWGLLEHALQKVGHGRDELRGALCIESGLPLGAGLGGSGALCVGVGRVFAHWGYIDASRIYEFSRELENLFHGESSGVDIAVALEGRGLRFMRGGERNPVTVAWQPHMYLSYCGKRGVTADCVKKVCELGQKSPHLGEKLDSQMREAVELAERALATSQPAVLDQLCRSIDLARDCFYQWGLCDGALDQHMHELIQAGALAVKPTGSGGGGHVLSLWENDAEELVKAFQSSRRSHISLSRLTL